MCFGGRDGRGDGLRASEQGPEDANGETIIKSEELDSMDEWFEITHYRYVRAFDHVALNFKSSADVNAGWALADHEPGDWSIVLLRQFEGVGYEVEMVEEVEDCDEHRDG